MVEAESFKMRLKLSLELRNMKPSELSEKTGISKPRISRYLSGEYQPKQTALHNIAIALDVSEAYLLGFDVPPERKTTMVEVTQEEFLILDSYRRNPDMQPAIKRLLGISDNWK